MRRYSDRALPLLLAAQLVFGVTHARAEEGTAAAPPAEVEKARLLYNEALDLRDAGDTKGALQFFLAAYSHVRTPVIGLDLARAHLALGHVLDALTIVEAIGRMPVTPDEGEKSIAARTEAARLSKELAPRVAVLRVTTSRTLVGGESLSIDGLALSPDEAALGRRLDPGKHTIVLRALPAMVIDVEVKEGETLTVPLTLDSDKPTSATAAPIVPRAKTTSPLVYLGFGVGGGALLVGAITGLTAFSRTASLDRACASNGNCPPDREGDIKSAKTMGTISTISFVVAGAGLGVGVMGLLGVGAKPVKETQGSVSPYVGLGSAGVVGAF
jgi:hypothetical protein